MEPNRRLIADNSGQFAIEAVLLMLVLLGCFTVVTNQLKEKKVLQNFVTEAVGRVKNMAEYGTWKPVCKAIKGGASQTAANCHPNSINRALSSDPQ